MWALLKTGFSLFMGGNTLVRLGVYAVAGIVLVGGVWMHGYGSGRSSANVKALETKIARLERALEGAEDVRAAHDAALSRDTQLDHTNKELIDATPEDDLLCFDAGHIERLRQLR